MTTIDSKQKKQHSGTKRHTEDADDIRGPILTPQQFKQLLKDRKMARKHSPRHSSRLKS
jgi:hypothetical protein